MKKKIISVFFILLYVAGKSQSNADSMLLFFKNHPKSSAIFALKNNAVLGAFNETKVMPLATMPDLLVAIEFAKHATYLQVDTAERINLKDLVKYYFESEKIDAYENWLAIMLQQKKVQNNTVSLMDVVHGMLQYGVLANSEFLMDKIGFDNIKSSIKSFNLNDHTAIMPVVGALALYQNRAKTSEKKIWKAIANMDEEEYCKAAFLMHLAIKGDSTFKAKMPKKITDTKILNMWSDRLAQASVKTYGVLLQSLLKEQLLSPANYRMLRAVVEWPMQFSTVNKMFDRFMMKGSATPTVFSQAQYGKLKDGSEIVLVYSCANLTPTEMQQITRWHQQFELQLFTDMAFQQRINALQTVKKNN